MAIPSGSAIKYRLLPSGENCGEVCIAFGLIAAVVMVFVVTSRKPSCSGEKVSESRIVPDPRSVTKAMVFPSGDQTGSMSL